MGQRRTRDLWSAIGWLATGASEAPRLHRPGRRFVHLIRSGATGCSALGALLAGLLLCLIPLLALPAQPASALSLPWGRALPGESPSPDSRSALPLQEVPPPVPVQQLQVALASHQPVVEILSPADDSLLPPGPWTLKLRVHDWPLVDAGPLGLGPHLVVQLDQEPPRRWTASEGSMPELSPGSHRLTVYAALPWGEASRSPGAWQQIRLHRTAPNPLSLPPKGSPQLLAVSPFGAVPAEPVLLDWLLLDAPLQNLRGSDSQWRLRLGINGDDLLLDQQTPLWLRGWRSGRNAVRLELLDGRGDPLNPPFNAVVLEVDRSSSGPAPRWLGERFSPEELSGLLGQRVPLDQAPALAAPAESAESAELQSLMPAPLPADDASAGGRPAGPPDPQPEPASDPPAPTTPAGSAVRATALSDSDHPGAADSAEPPAPDQALRNPEQRDPQRRDPAEATLFEDPTPDVETPAPGAAAAFPEDAPPLSAPSRLDASATPAPASDLRSWEDLASLQPQRQP